ncbi:MAG: bifunctional diguanylate cyclase/phosphodiesterase [Proteobacteria bacterium]|nr:bifunctional diguanylate cyclase/phosphodiesterase [Pseudomonadota bacterium]
MHIASVYAGHPRNQLDVLAIHSYHQEYPWTSSQYEAFKKQLAKKLPEYIINFSSEYLDTKRIAPSGEYRENFLHYINAKYGGHRPDLIYVTDDNALNFIYSRGNKLEWNIPVIYSGINNANIEKQNPGYSLAGIFEYKDIYSSISLAESITDNTSEIIFLGDGGTTDKAIKEIVDKVGYEDNGYKISQLSFSRLDDLIEKLDSIGDSTVILTTVGRIHDDQGELLDLGVTIKEITSTGKRILVMEDAYLFPGVLGGYVTSGRVQGESAANIASGIILGTEPVTISGERSSEFVLSWPEVRRFELDIDDPLLSKAKIINLPPPFVERYPQLAKWLLLFVSILVVIIVGFIFHTRRKNLQLKKQYTDSLTGLPNRIKLLSDINRVARPCLIIIDINNFKSINNLYGLKIGDKLLHVFAKKVHQYINGEYSFYRLCGNQFAILVEQGHLKDEADKYITTLLKDIQNNRYHIGSIDINLTLTAGLSRNEHEFLVPRAEQALQSAKENNKDYVLAGDTKEVTDQHNENLIWAQKLNTALLKGRIFPYFQLISHNKTGKSDKHEALVRMMDEDGRIVTPSFFLDAAKSTRQYSLLTKAMIEKTFQAIVDHGSSISINLTVDDIRDETTIDFFKSKLDEYKVAKMVIVELTESEGIENYSEVSTFIQDIKALGCQVAIDDFGTGYSNFKHLIHLNVDYLKIDGSIIQNIATDRNSEIVAKTLVDFARQLGIETIAEYVDSQEILDKVKEIGIDYSQGYFIRKPQATF